MKLNAVLQYQRASRSLLRQVYVETMLALCWLMLAQVGSCCPHLGSSWPHVGSMLTQVGLCWLHVASRCLQVGSKMAQDGSMLAQVGLKMPKMIFQGLSVFDQELLFLERSVPSK